MLPRHTSCHALPAHLARDPTHLRSWLLSTHPTRRTGLHSHHSPRLTDMRLPRAGDAGMANLLHLLGIHGLAARRHGRMAVGRHARVHSSGRLRLVCRHHLARLACTTVLFNHSPRLPVVLLLVVGSGRSSRYDRQLWLALAGEGPRHRPVMGRATGSTLAARCIEGVGSRRLPSPSKCQGRARSADAGEGGRGVGRNF